MHHLTSIVSSLSLTLCLFYKRSIHQSTRIHGTRANIRKKMDFLEQENRVLKEEIATMQAKIDEMAAMQTQMDELTELVRTVRAAQNRPPPPPPPVRTQIETSGFAIPVWTMCSESPSFSAPQRYVPWFMSLTAGEILRPTACEALMPTLQHATYIPPPGATRPQATMTYSTPAIHIIPQDEKCNTPNFP